MSSSTSLPGFLSALGTLIKDDIIIAVAEPVMAFLTNVQGNPDPLNVALQFNALNANLLAAVPGLEKTAIGQVAAQANTQLQAALTAAQAGVAAAKPAGS